MACCRAFCFVFPGAQAVLVGSGHKMSRHFAVAKASGVCLRGAEAEAEAEAGREAFFETRHATISCIKWRLGGVGRRSDG